MISIRWTVSRHGCTDTPGDRLIAMNHVHLILPDLFLPRQYAAQASDDLVLPALQKLLARATATSASSARSIEAALCAAFAVQVHNDIPVAPISAAFDGLGQGVWLRADAVHLRLQRDRMLLSQPSVTRAEAGQFCAGLNEYFAAQGMTFFAPHPQRWYVRVERVPDMQTTPLSEVMGGNVRGALPRGTDAPRWNRVFNESQMLLHAHPLNAAREARGELPVNSLWFWGGGEASRLQKNYDSVSSDEQWTRMFAAAAGVPYAPAGGSLTPILFCGERGDCLLLLGALREAIQAGDLHGWRVALQAFETDVARPLWDALRGGELASLRIDVLAGENTRSLVLTRRDVYRFWRRGKRLAAYSMV